MRLKCYEDLIAGYEQDTNPHTMAESKRKAKIVRKMIDGETVKNKFREIRRTGKPFTASSLSKLLVPSGSSATAQDDVDTSAYHILQNRDPSEILWETVIDRSHMEEHLLRYNRESFRAASESPLGNGLLYDAITFSVCLWRPTRSFMECLHVNGLRMITLFVSLSHPLLSLNRFMTKVPSKRK